MLDNKEVREYLARIGWFEGHEAMPAVSTADLDALIWLHQTHVPFENVDARMRRVPASLDVDALFRKIVIGKRGGICYELNAAFHALLTGLGFPAVPVFARNLRNLPEGSPLPISHRGEMVLFGNEPRYADVGYGGPMAGCSLPVAHRSETCNAGRWFRISRSQEEGWWEISSASATGIACSSPPADTRYEPVLLFHDRPAREEDFDALCWYATTNPRSVFTQLLFLNLRTETGNVSLRGSVRTVVDGFDRRCAEITDEEAIRFAEERFGLKW